MNLSDDHFIAVFRFKLGTTPGQKGDDIYYIKEQLKNLVHGSRSSYGPAVPHVDEVEVLTLDSI
jgi:hypothetical protein